MKMNAMKSDTEQGLVKCRSTEEQLRVTERYADEAEHKITQLHRKIQAMSDDLDIAQEELNGKLKLGEQKDKIASEAEAEIAALNRRILLLEEDLERTSERLKTTTVQLGDASTMADGNERQRRGLETSTQVAEHGAYELELQLKESKMIMVEADRKFDEVTRKLAMAEADMGRTEQRCQDGEDKIVEIEEELRVMGSNLKSFEASDEKARHREDSYNNSIDTLQKRLKDAEARAEYAERSVHKLQDEVVRLEEDLIKEREAYNQVVVDLDGALDELTAV